MTVGEYVDAVCEAHPVAGTPIGLFLEDEPVPAEAPIEELGGLTVFLRTEPVEETDDDTSPYDDVPLGPIAAILEWIDEGDDDDAKADRARAALELENEQDKPRVSLVEALESLVASGKDGNT